MCEEFPSVGKTPCRDAVAPFFEPYRVKVVEPIPLLSPEERRLALERAEWNLFKLRGDEVTIDLLTDSGFSALSAEQWAALARGDECYAGSQSFFRLERIARALTGVPHILPAHQGRGAEGALFAALGISGRAVISNGLFDTTRAHVEAAGGVGLDLPSPAARRLADPAPFKGDIDLDAVRHVLAEAENGRHVPIAACIMTVTNNVYGAQPVSLSNLRAVRGVLSEFKVPLFLDACRIAENAWLVKTREPSESRRSAREIAAEMFSLSDGFTFSAKKDAFGAIGGLLGLRDAALAERARAVLVLREGFPTYGGLAGRDLESLAVGLEEAFDERWLAFRSAQMEQFGRDIAAAGAPIVEPPGGHAIYIDARRLLPHIAPEQLPAQALACDLYLRGGIRTVEVGTFMFGKSRGDGRGVAAPFDLVRLAVPRRVYSGRQLDYVVEVVRASVRGAARLRGLEIVRESQPLRHFTAAMRPIGAAGAAAS
jgi:tryptophanase